jgi:hypothetical protein
MIILIIQQTKKKDFIERSIKFLEFKLIYFLMHYVETLKDNSSTLIINHEKDKCKITVYNMYMIF